MLMAGPAAVALLAIFTSCNVAATSLTIGNDVVVKYGSDASMVVRDGLATGQGVTFTSLNADGIEGQTQRTPGSPHGGDWRGLQILPTAAPEDIYIDGLTLRYAGSSNAAALEFAHNPYIFDALYISDSLLGIRALDATEAALTNTTLVVNTVGLEANGYAVPSFSQSQITFNGYGALNLTPQVSVQALQNWWGAASGPKDPVANPNGTGNAVSTGINYGQYLAKAPLLACSIRVADGKYTISQQSVALTLYCVNASGYRLSESTDFGSASFASMASNPMAATYTFTGGQRTFTLYAQFQSGSDSTVTTTVALPMPITYIPPPPPPTVTITAPPAGSEVSTDTVIAADVSSTINIAKADFYVDATRIATITSAPYQTTWSLGGVSFANHTLKVVATDALDQTGQASEVVTVVPSDQAGPLIQNVTLQGAPFADGATVTSSGTLAADISDPSGIASVAAAIDGTTLSGITHTGTQYTLPLTFSQFANSAHVLTLTAKDVYANTTQVSIGFTLAIAAPAAPVITAPADGAVVTQPKVTVSGTAAVGSQVQLYLDGSASGALLAVSGSGTFSSTVSLPDQQTHHIAADARTSRGTSPPSNLVAVTYTPPPPTILITSPAKNATLTADTDISVAIIDTADITQVEFDIDGAAVATLTTTPYTWHWALSSANSGSHTIAVKATDTIGNLLQASIPVTVQITPPPPPPIVTPYTGRLASITPKLSYGEQPITISGSAVDRTSGGVVPNALLTLVLKVNGFKRQIGITTGDDGNFVYAFHPYSTDAGTYAVSLIHPQETTLPVLDTFTINRLSVSPSTYSLSAARTIVQTIPVTVKASSGAGITGVYLSADPTAQPSGSMPPGITISAPAPINIAPGGQAQIKVQFLADNSGGNTGTVVLVAHAADSGSVSRGTVAIKYSLSAPTPALFPSPTYIQTGVTQGKQVLSTVKLTNKGLIAATNVTARVVNNDGSNAPAWVGLASGTSIASLDVGATEAIQFSAAPTTSVTDGIYQFRIRIAADNATGGDIPVSVAVTNSTVGNVLFNAADIYTNTLDGSGNTILGLAGATIKVQNQNVYTVVKSATTDTSGNAEMDNLPIGTYTFVASAPNHASASGVVTVQPGITVPQSVFLDYNVISIQWTVTETEIPDEYQVTLDATYQTQVPAPVVLIEPTSVNLPNMQVGEIFTGEMTITNYGLVRADDVVFTPAQSDAYFKYEFMGDVPASLEAHQRISLPYKITALSALPSGTSSNVDLSKSLRAAGGATKAGLKVGTATTSKSSTSGCNTYSRATKIQYGFACANGNESSGSNASVFARVYGQCSSGGGGGGSGGTGGGNDANGFGGPLYGAPVGQPLGNSPGCTPICISCLLKGGGFGGGGAFGGGGPFGGGPEGPTSGGGGPPPLFDGPLLQ